MPFLIVNSALNMIVLQINSPLLITNLHLTSVGAPAGLYGVI